MRKREDLPQPLGPMTRTWWPRFMEKERALTRTLPPGVIMGLGMLECDEKPAGFDLHIDEFNVLALDNSSSSFH